MISPADKRIFARIWLTFVLFMIVVIGVVSTGQFHFLFICLLQTAALIYVILITGWAFANL